MKIALLGDIALFGVNTVVTRNWKKKFEGVKEILDSCDFVVGNLETPLTDSIKVVGGKSAYIKGKPEDIEILKYLGVTHVTLANNHIFDYCAKGLKDTLETLEKNKIDWYGVNGRTVDIVCDDSRVKLLGYCCYSTNAVGLEENDVYINVLNPIEMDKDITNAEREGYLPILSCHWGQEHVHYPDRDHLEIARWLASKHEIVIHGHHPHVIQGIESINRSLIMYSLGNFCFDDVYTSKSKDPLVRLSADNQESFVCVLTIIGNKIKKYDVIPFSFNKREYTLNNTIQEKIAEWTEFLKTPKDRYILKRREDIDIYISGRKKKRDLKWYLKRLNYNSVLMIKRSRKNEKRYSAIMKEFQKA